MKILRRYISHKSGEGTVSLQAEEEDDIYHLYNLIYEGDEVEASTVRNVITESMSGARDKTRMQFKVTIRVEKVEFDVEQCSLRLNGPNVKENEHIRMGQYHTLEVEIDRPIKISKDSWETVHMELLDDISDPMKKADVAAIVMQEGLAHVCLIRSAMTKTLARIEKAMPKKKAGNQAYEQSLEKFFKEIYDTIARHINFDLIKVILVGSPGFLNEDFMTYLLQRALRESEDKEAPIFKNKGKFLKVASSSGYKNAIEEMLSKPEVVSQLVDVKAVAEVKALQDFYDMLSKDEDRACYGFDDVQRANALCAIDQLLVSDSMYRNHGDLNVRKKVMDLMDSVKESGGKIFKFSSLHVSGEQLNNYTGIAAILRFPVFEEEEQA